MRNLTGPHRAGIFKTQSGTGFVCHRDFKCFKLFRIPNQCSTHQGGKTQIVEETVDTSTNMYVKEMNSCSISPDRVDFRKSQGEGPFLYFILYRSID